MDKKEAFKEFVRKHPSLTRYIKNNNKTWQNLYEIYDIYGDDDKAWEPYFEEGEIYNAGGVAERKQTGWICGRCKSVKSITRYYKTNYCPN